MNDPASHYAHKRRCSCAAQLTTLPMRYTPGRSRTITIGERARLRYIPACSVSFTQGRGVTLLTVGGDPGELARCTTA